MPHVRLVALDRTGIACLSEISAGTESGGGILFNASARFVSLSASQLRHESFPVGMKGIGGLGLGVRLNTSWVPLPIQLV